MPCYRSLRRVDIITYISKTHHSLVGPQIIIIFYDNNDIIIMVDISLHNSVWVGIFNILFLFFSNHIYSYHTNNLDFNSLLDTSHICCEWSWQVHIPDFQKSLFYCKGTFDNYRSSFREIILKQILTSFSR